MKFATKIFPALSIAALTLLSALPWGLAPDIRFVLPLIPVVAIHFWLVCGSDRVSEWFVFFDGLMLDVLTNGPLGFWSIVYLAGFAASLLLVRSARRVRGGGWASLTLVVSGLAVVVWGISSLYSFDIADWRPLVVASLAAACAYPPLALLLGLLDIQGDKPTTVTLREGGRNA